MTRLAFLALCAGIVFPAALASQTNAVLRTGTLNTAERGGSPIGFEDAARLALAASADLKTARAGKALREGVWKLGLRAYLPQIGFSVSEDDRLSQTGADSFLKNYTVSLDQLLWDGGRTASARALERSELALLGDELERSASDITEAALNAYRKVLVDRKIIVIRESALESLKEQRRILAEELALERVTALDMAEGEITVERAALELELLRLETEESERAFAELLGLDSLPPLSESIDIYRGAFPFRGKVLEPAALSRNPDLASGRHQLVKRQTEAKFASLSWLPTLRATGSFTLSGRRYPLTKYNWSIGLTVTFSSPWFNASVGGNAGWEPPHEKTARLQSSVSPLPDPASGLGAKQAELALALEREKYAAAAGKTGRAVFLCAEQIALNERRRIAAIAEMELAEKNYRLSELLLGLGRITRIELMDARVEYAAQEIKAAEAAVALLVSERELERLLNLKPGTLAEFYRRLGGTL
jgi:outer membrane protein TolC